MTNRITTAATLLLALNCAGCRDDAPGVPFDAAEPEPPKPAATGDLPPLIDGAVEDWLSVKGVVEQIDPAGDAGSFDVSRLRAKIQGTELYMAFELADLPNVPAVHLYGGGGNDAVFDVRAGDRLLRLNTGQRAATVFIAGNNEGTHLSWDDIGFRGAPSHAAKVFELRVDLSALQIGVGDDVDVTLVGADPLDTIRVTAGPPAIAASVMSAGKLDSGDLRVANLNTEHAGIADAGRGPRLMRLLRAVEADVVSLQELAHTSPTEIRHFLEAADPPNRQWYVERDFGGSIVGNAVASHHPLLRIPTTGERHVAVVVDSDPPVVVINVHLKCCGSFGSGEDHKRLDQLGDVQHAVGKLRLGELGAAFEAYQKAPVLVMGDFNDVGSPQLSQLLTSERAGGLVRWMLPQLGSHEVFTWQGSSQFPPAILDLFFHSEPLTRRNAFVLNSAELDAAALEGLGLWQTDSAASDHLLMVADFALAP